MASESGQTRYKRSGSKYPQNCSSVWCPQSAIKSDYRNEKWWSSVGVMGSVPAEYQMSVQTASVHAAIFWVQNPAAQSGCKIGQCLPPLFGFRASVGREERKRGAGGDGVMAAGMLFSQILSDDAVEGRRWGQVALLLLLHCWSLSKKKKQDRINVFTVTFISQTNTMNLWP